MTGNVWIISARKTDGRYNKGKVVGKSMTYPYLSTMTFSSYKAALVEYQYQVAYQDVFTKKCCLEWFSASDLSKTKPTTKLSGGAL